MKLIAFPYEYQLDVKDYGPACLKIIAKHYGKYYSLQKSFPNSLFHHVYRYHSASFSSIISKAVIDTGIPIQDVNFVYLVLVAKILTLC